MRNTKAIILSLAVIFVLSGTGLAVSAQTPMQNGEEFGPVVRAYLGYLRNEQEVVDDRVSRREISQVYYRRNSNRIRALRQMALKLARQSNNDYLPELEAVTRDEFGLLFQRPPRPEELAVGDVKQNTFRFLGAVRSNEVFYVFARLDPYEQSELLQKASEKPAKLSIAVPNAESGEKNSSRPRRVIP